MKQINSILRTLCLTALLCMTSVNASAYEIFNEVMMSNGIYVVQQDKTIETLNVKKEQVLIILSGVTITANTNFTNSGTIYVFGTLNNNVTNMNENMGTIYLVDKGKIKRTTDKFGNEWFNKPQSKNFSEIATKKKQEVQAPTTTADGVREYWMKGIAQGDDFYPMEYYSDEDCNQKIDNFEEWKKGEGKPGWPKIGDKEYMFDDNLIFPDKAAYQCEYSFTPKALIYSRTFANPNWQPLYVPFAMSYNEWENKFDVAAINNFHEYTDADGKTVKTELEVRLVKSGKLKPNHPYLIKAHGADEIYPKNIELELNTNEICKPEEKSYSCSSMESKYTFTGTYKEMKNLMTSKFIFMSGGKLCKAEDDNVALWPQRWYLKIESLGSQVDDESGSANAKAMQFDIKLLDDEATGIDEITVTRTPLHSSSDAVYNLNGMRVNEGYKGIVIQNGKKVYRK